MSRCDDQWPDGSPMWTCLPWCMSSTRVPDQTCPVRCPEALANGLAEGVEEIANGPAEGMVAANGPAEAEGHPEGEHAARGEEPAAVPALAGDDGDEFQIVWLLSGQFRIYLFCSWGWFCEHQIDQRCLWDEWFALHHSNLVMAVHVCLWKYPLANLGHGIEWAHGLEVHSEPEPWCVNLFSQCDSLQMV